MATKIREKQLAKGYMRYFIDVHFEGKRKYIYPPGLKCKIRPQTEMERRTKKENKMIVEEIARKIELDFLRGQYALEEKFKTNYDFAVFMREWIQLNKGLLDIRMYSSALAYLIKFYGKEYIPCYDLTETFWKRFTSHLKQNLNGATPNNYWKKIKRVVKAAVDMKYFREDTTQNIIVNSRPFCEKSVLTIDEIKAIFNTQCSNTEISRAFMFSTQTGLRFCDIIRLQWKHIDNCRLNIVQHKTKVPVSVMLKPEMLEMLGVSTYADDYIFKLPSHTTCLKVLEQWCKDAGIHKKVTWHVARHSFATNLLEHGVDVAITSKLLGHTSLVNTQRYVRISENVKEQAILKLPSITK